MLTDEWELLSPWGLINHLYEEPEVPLEDRVLIGGGWLLGADCAWTITFPLSLLGKRLAGPTQ